MMTVVLESALRTAITVGLVWVTLKLFRVTHVVSQKIAWSLVLIAALAMPSVMRWHAFRVSLPTALRSYSTIRPSTGAAVFPQVRTIEGATSNSMRRAIKPPDTRSGLVPRMAKLNRSAASVYLTICAILLLRLLLGLTWAFRVWRRARPVSALSTTLMKVRSSGDISTPLTIGFCVVLPLPFENWDRAKLQMVLAHERSHIRQADFFLQLLARLHAVIFWFSPLAWWLQKELAGLGEAISDQAAIMQAPDRCSYAEVLLEFAAMYRRPLAGIPMARRSGINRRVERILNDTLFRCAFINRKRHVFVAVAFSVALLLSTSQFVVRAASRVSGPTPLAGQGIVQKTSIELPTAESSEASAQSAPPSVPSPHVAVSPAAQGLVLSPPQYMSDAEVAALQKGNHQVITGYGFRFSTDGDSYALVDQPDRRFTAVGDWNRKMKLEIDRARRISHGTFLWFTRGGRTYIVDDPAIVKQVESIYGSMKDLGQQNGGSAEEERVDYLKQQAGVTSADPSIEYAYLKAEVEKGSFNARIMTDADRKTQDIIDESLHNGKARPVH
jgi:beta-lactamase regulating signal transducer with metallopeptidase domain